MIPLDKLLISFKENNYMRRNLLLASLLALPLLASPSLAQDRGYTLGIVGGANFPSTDVDARTLQTGTSDSTGIAIGVHAEGRLGRNWTFVSQILYVQRKTEVTFAAVQGQPETRTTYTLDFLEVPYHLKYSFGMGRAVQPYLFGGGSVGYRLSANGEHVTSGRPTFDQSESNTFDKVNWALEAGGGLSFRAGDNTFILGDVRYVYGLTNMATQDGDSWKTRDVRVMVGVLWGL
jgi:hypothetical protein